MSGGVIASLVASVLMLAWVVNGYSARGVPMKQTVRMALAWVAIFALGLLAYSVFAGLDSSNGPSTPVSNLA